jgi:hypothetical protein
MLLIASYTYSQESPATEESNDIENRDNNTHGDTGEGKCEDENADGQRAAAGLGKVNEQVSLADKRYGKRHHLPDSSVWQRIAPRCLESRCSGK